MIGKLLKRLLLISMYLLRDEDINNITNISIWVIEKKVGFFNKRWSRDYQVENSNMHSPIKSLSRSYALSRMEVLAKGVVLQEGEVVKV